MAVELGSGGALRLRLAAKRELRLTFVGANLASEPQGEDPTGRQSIYYTNATNWHCNQHFKRVRYSRIYPGINVVFDSNANHLEYTFEIEPHADLSVIRLRYEGADVRIVDGGDLEVDAGTAKLIQQRPHAFQKGASRRPVDSSYRISDNRDVFVQVGDHDPGSQLVIDPVLSFSTYIGGSSFDAIYAIATDPSGTLFVTGESSSGDLWNNASPSSTNRRAFVAKLDPAGAQVLFTVYLGGNGSDAGKAIAVSSSGAVYVTGVTSSTNFPVTAGAFSTRHSGMRDVFIAKLASNGALQYSTLLGASSSDFGFGIAVDSSGQAYVAGQTESMTFPTTQGVLQSIYHGGLSDCFVSKLNASGNALVYSTLLGGRNLDVCSAIVIDAAGNAYVTGATHSSDFPTYQPIQSDLRGTSNAFVVKINPTGSAAVYSTFLGGSNVDQATCIALDVLGDAYVAGSTSSFDFPTTSQAVQTFLRGSQNAFVTKISPDGRTLVYSTLLGGSQQDIANSIALDQNGRAVIGGTTTSADFPLTGAIQTSFAGGADSFVSVLDLSGDRLALSSYFGGSGDDRGYAVAAGPGNKLYLAGITSSSDFPSVAAIQPSLNTAYDAFALAVTYSPPDIIVSITPSSVTLGQAQTQQFTAALLNTTNQSVVWSLAPPLGSVSPAGTYIAPVTITNPQTVAIIGTSLSDASKSASASIQLVPPVAAPALTPPGGTYFSVQSVVISTSTPGASINYTTDGIDPSETRGTLYAGPFSVASTTTVKALAYKSGTADSAISSTTYSILTALPSLVSISPQSGTGASTTLAVTVSDQGGVSAIGYVYVIVNASQTGYNSCYIEYNRSANTIRLANDTGLMWPLPVVLGGGPVMSNNQCSLNPGTASSSATSTNLTINIPLTFPAAYAGTKNMYVMAFDVTGSSSGWQSLGTWTVPGSAPPSVTSANPTSGSGSSKTFALTLSDSIGASFIGYVYVLVNSTLNGANSCFVEYNRAANTIRLVNDTGLQWPNPVTLGTGSTMSNSQCSLSPATASSSMSGNNLTVNIPLTFATAYSGAKNVYAMVIDMTGLSSGWQIIGTWTVPGSGAPQAVSVAPASGSGNSQMFAFTVEDPSGAPFIGYVYLLVNASLNGVNSCFVEYNRSANTIRLVNDTGMQWPTPVSVGTGTVMSNSQCSLNTAAVSSSASGSSLTINVPLTFAAVYSGLKNVYAVAIDVTGQGSGWQSLGTWTVPRSGPPTVVSVFPASGTGSSQTFALTISDPGGALFIAYVYVLVNSAVIGVNSCFVEYNRAANTIRLVNDSGLQWPTPILLGTGTAMSNSQCSLNPATASSSTAGNSLTVNVPLTFLPTYSGSKSFFVAAYDMTGQGSGWQAAGSWRVP